MNKQTNDFIISLKRHTETEERFGDLFEMTWQEDEFD